MTPHDDFGGGKWYTGPKLDDLGPPPRLYDPTMTHAPLSEQYVEFMERRDKYGPTPDGGNR